MLDPAEAIDRITAAQKAPPGHRALHAKGHFYSGTFNASPEAQTVAGTGAGWRLHDVQASGTDAVVKGSTVAADAVTVPGRTTAVFER